MQGQTPCCVLIMSCVSPPAPCQAPVGDIFGAPSIFTIPDYTRAFSWPVAQVLVLAGNDFASCCGGGSERPAVTELLAWGAVVPVTGAETLLYVLMIP